MLKLNNHRNLQFMHGQLWTPYAVYANIRLLDKLWRKCISKPESVYPWAHDHPSPVVYCRRITMPVRRGGTAGHTWERLAQSLTNHWLTFTRPYTYLKMVSMKRESCTNIKPAYVLFNCSYFSKGSLIVRGQKANSWWEKTIGERNITAVRCDRVNSQ